MSATHDEDRAEIAARISAGEHPATVLWRHHHPSTGYPAGVVPVPTPIPGLAFFPGGFGLWNPAPRQALPPFPFDGVMVLGHDFHSESGYLASRTRGAEPINMPTWRNLINLLDQVGLEKHTCFFTNFYMGLRTSSSAMGVFPGARDKTFVAHCKAFVLTQIAVQKPRLIISLGVHVPLALSTQSPDLETWGGKRGFRNLDAQGPVRRDVAFVGLPKLRTTVVALLHPSLRQASLRHRRYGEQTGQIAESSMLKQAMIWAGVDGASRSASVSVAEELQRTYRERRHSFAAKMNDQVQPGEPDAWAKWLKILDGDE